VAHWFGHFICPVASFLPMTSTGELSELLVIPSIPRPSSVGLWLPMSHQTAKGRDSSENTGIAVESEARV
jgi:hypothetical protein